MRPVFQNVTRIARSMRFSILFRSGAKPGNVPYFSGPGGVTPTSCPPRADGREYLRHARGAGVSDASHALNGSPGFSVKYGVPDAAVAPLIGGNNTGATIVDPTMCGWRKCRDSRRIASANSHLGAARAAQHLSDYWREPCLAWSMPSCITALNSVSVLCASPRSCWARPSNC
jgi:hypothetical protein